MARVFGSPGRIQSRHVELVGVVHADDLSVVRDQVAVEPDLGAVVDAGQLQQVGGVACGRLERRAVPPVLLVEVLRHLVEQVLAVVEVRVGAVVLQRLEDGGGHVADGVPARRRVVGTGHGRAVGTQLGGGRELPAVRQFDPVGRLLGPCEGRE